MNAVERWSREWCGEGPGDATAAERWSREWYGQCPDVWMFDRDANPVVLPPEAIGFRVRRLPPGSRGLGAPVRDEFTGAWLLVPRSAGPEELADLMGYLPGRYKLVAVDERHMALRDVPIVVFSVTPTMARRAGRMGAEAAPSAAAASSAATPRDALIAEIAELVRALTAPDPLVLELVRALGSVLIEALGVIRAQAIAIARNAIDLVNAFAELVTAAGKAGVWRRAASQPVAVALVVPEPDPRSTPAPAVASEPDAGRGERA